ncbi:carbohydrate ABC transporter permease [Aerococcaceae bacterium INB8]|uniref:Carbohydrate ABC transporter permease n=1 Tax=Ruoffia halotolerans TaxID=2748684 RepID=A0A839A3E5_9LACT|nr:carbohydrate ABC transporter permease [Ruoffia halotolerans]MBA5728431.1 carbohydrate ABC transporter permease [Ruoffia halotolerans]
MKSMKKSNKLALIIAVIMAIFFIVPLLYMFFTSFKSMSESLSSAGLVPQSWTMENYQSLLEDTSTSPMIRWLLNTTLVTVVGTTIVVTIDVLAAYALARLNLPFKNIALFIVIASLTIPGIVTLFPNFFIMQEIGVIDTYIPLIVIYTSSSMGVYMIYNFLKSFPGELEEAAALDGASRWQILRHVILPSIKGPTTTLAIMTFLAIYNDFLWPSLVTNSTEMKTVTVGVANLVQGANFVNPGRMMAATVIATIPALIVFVFAQRFFIQNDTASGIK